MKPLIIIGAYCPDIERQTLLENCIESLNPIKKDFDILISSHAPIPENIVHKVDYVLYDKTNELITDWDMMGTPWFSPFDGLNINSALISNYSTYLAVYRTLIGGLGMAKVFGYERAYWLEYDSVILDHTEFYNDLALENNVSIQYRSDSSLQWGLGYFMPFNVSKLNDTFLKYDREKLLELLKNSPHKTNEYITQDILESTGHPILYKDFSSLSANTYNLSAFTKKDEMDDWVTPYYDTADDKIKILAWNIKKNYPINVTCVINNSSSVFLNDIPERVWRIQDLDTIDKIDEILIIVNSKIKNRILINTPDLKDKFKKINKTIYYDTL